MPASPSAFGQLVKRRRLAQGWSQKSLAQATGLSDGYISLIETGRRGIAPSPRTIASLVQALECDPEELFRVAGRQMPLADIHRLIASLDSASEVVRAIERDPLLKPLERDNLVRLYNSYLLHSARRYGK